MTKILIVFVVVTVLFVAAAEAATAAPTNDKPDPVVFTAIFGSCNRPEVTTAFWPHISAFARNTSHFFPSTTTTTTSAAAAAQLGSAPPSAVAVVTERLDSMIWLGDIVYHDHVRPFPGLAFPLFEKSSGPDRQRWEQLATDSHYKKFVEGTRFVSAIYDDHDISHNDCTKLCTDKHENKEHLLDFIHVPKDSPRRARSGVYSFTKIPFEHSAVTGGKINKEKEQQSQQQKINQKHVCVILLDNRFNLDESNGDGTGDILGNEQWTWFEQVLATGRDPQLQDEENDAASSGGNTQKIDDVCVVTFVGSGVQFISDSPPAENWDEFPAARRRLFQTLARSGSRRFVLLSGDVHFAEIETLSAKPIAITSGSAATAEPFYARCPESPFAHYGQDLVDITASGFTQQLPGVFASNFEFLFPSHRRKRKAGANSGALVKQNFGLIQIRCEDAINADTCKTFVGIANVPQEKAGDRVPSSSTTTPEIYNFVEIKFPPALTAPLPKSEYLPAGCPSTFDSGSIDSWDIMPYRSSLAKFVMFGKSTMPFSLFLYETSRLRTLFFMTWFIIISALAVFVLVVCFCCRCVCSRKKSKRD